MSTPKPDEKAVAVFVAWRDLSFAKGRFALMGTVIALITLLVGILSGLTAGLAPQNISAIEALPADRIAFAEPADGQDPSFTTSTVSRDRWERLGAMPGVTAAEPLGVSTARASAPTGTATVSVFAVRSGSALVPGGESVTVSTTVLSTAAADELAATVGDTVLVGDRELTVVAVRGDDSFSHTPVVWTELTDPEASVVALTTTSDFDADAVGEATGVLAVSKTDSLSAIGSFTAENGSLQLMRGFLFVIAALVIGAFFTVWTIQRSGDIAVLKALGASTGSLLRDALGQAVVLLVAGTAVGTALAAGIGAAVSGTVPFDLAPATLVVPSLVTVVLGAAGAALAVRRVTSVDPLIALGSAR